MSWTRRALLASSLLVGGCALHQAPLPQGPSPTRPAPNSSGSSGTAPTPPPRSPTPSAPVSATGEPTAPPALPTRDDVVAEFDGRSPTAFGTAVAGVTRGLEGPAVLLTFDACGGPRGSGVDAPLLAVLRRLQVPATLFLNLRWIDANQTLAAELAADALFRLGSHGRRHVPLSVTGRAAYGIAGTTGVGEIYDELTATHEWFVQATGAPPRWFRPGTAHLDDVAVSIAGRLGLGVAGFAVNADAGATASRREVSHQVQGAVAGDIVLAHMNQPAGQTAEGFADALPRLLRAGVRFTTLP